MAICETDILTVDRGFVPKPEKAGVLSEHTANTWQPNRDINEIINNTDQGKRAEEAVMSYFSAWEHFSYQPYDHFRKDSYLKNAPFDGIFYSDNTDIEVVRNMARDVIHEIAASKDGVISTALRAKMRAAKVYCVEIKSTKVSSKKREKAGDSELALKKGILEDDFLTYPVFCRKGDFTFDSYCRYYGPRLDPNGQGNYRDAILKNELAHSSDIFIRVYLDDQTSKIYLIGYLLKDDLFSGDICIKKMSKKGKSELALYYSKPLVNGYPLESLFSDKRLF
jgi:hypothetical protein